jgi:pimeloyl-ACP methyl ester carboxylesterase
MATDEPPATRMYRHRHDTLVTERGDPADPSLVCAHGTLMDRTMFRPQWEALADDYHVLAYDLRARTEHYAEPYDLYDLTDDLAALLDARGIDSCTLAGMSMGGFMALRCADRYPERLDGIVMIDSIALPHEESDVEQYGEMIDTAREMGEVPEPMGETVRHILFGATSNQERTDLVDHWVDRWLTYPGEAVYQEVSSWLERPDFTDELAGIEVPVLAIHGEEDMALELEKARDMVDHLPDARFEPIPEAGHSSNLENPEPANAAIEAFLEDTY